MQVILEISPPPPRMEKIYRALLTTRGQLTQAEAVDVWNVRQIQYECAVAFFQPFVHTFTQCDVKEGQPSDYIYNDDARQHS